ncbi:MAG: Spy/CpxP family protein refolding chaperone [Gemmatirosa sp.]|nr:Spy/CpxP family protein refolding chaperone [Gemmatirosa sp.]
MIKFRLAALGAALVFGVAATAHAQPPATGAGQTADARGAGRRGGGRGLNGALFQGIQLSDAQKTQLRTIQQKYGEQRRTLGQQLRGNQPAGAERARPDSAARTQMRALMERQMAEVRGVLTADQQRTFDQNAAAARKQFGERRARGGQRRA